MSMNYVQSSDKMSWKSKVEKIITKESKKKACVSNIEKKMRKYNSSGDE